MEFKNKNNTSIKWGNWIHLKIIQKIVSNKPGEHEVNELQKTAVLATAHVLRKVLM
jgi:hypothetical protein